MLPQPAGKTVVKLSTDDLVDDGLIDDDALLTEEDLKKPDPASLKVTGSETKRKACAGCNCGLAEELAKEERETIKKNTQNVKSSCGSVSSKII